MLKLPIEECSRLPEINHHLKKPETVDVACGNLVQISCIGFRGSAPFRGFALSLDGDVEPSESCLWPVAEDE